MTYFTEDDTELLRSIAHVVKASGGEVPEWMFSLKKASQSKKQQLGNSEIKRKPISARSKFDKVQRTRKKNMIEGTKSASRKTS